jgi:hypothetical protein
MIVSKKIVVTYRDLHVEGDEGRAHWECDYEFHKDADSRPRHVHNVIDSRFRFEDGSIRVHEDSCDFWAWFEQAMGPVGAGVRAVDFLEDTLEQVLKRGVPLDVEEKVRAKVKKAARDKIDAFVAQHPKYAG